MMKRFLVICALCVILCWSGIASAAWVLDSVEGETAANVSVTENEGWLEVSCNSTYAKYTYCWSGQNPPYCVTYQNGYIKLLRDKIYNVCISYGNGCTAKINPTSLADGTYLIKAEVGDSNGTYALQTIPFTIDNKPQIEITSPSNNETVEGTFDIAGTVDFKDNPEGIEGTISYYIDGSNPYSKSFEGTNVSFSYNNGSTKADLNAATKSNGEHTIRVVARAYNMVTSEKSLTKLLITRLKF